MSFVLDSSNLLGEYISQVIYGKSVDPKIFLKEQETVICNSSLKYVENVLNKYIDEYTNNKFNTMKDVDNIENQYNEIYATLCRLETYMCLYEKYKINKFLVEKVDSVREIFHKNISSNIFFKIYDNKTVMQNYLDKSINKIEYIEKLINICNFYKQNVIISGDNFDIINLLNNKIHNYIIENDYENAKRYINISCFLDNTELFDSIYINYLKQRMSLSSFNIDEENILKNYVMVRKNATTNIYFDNIMKDYEDSVNYTNLHNNSICVESNIDKYVNFNENKISSNYVIMRGGNTKIDNTKIILPDQVETNNHVFKILYEQCISNNFKKIDYDYKQSTAIIVLNGYDVRINLFELSILYMIESNMEINESYSNIIDKLLSKNIIIKNSKLKINENYKPYTIINNSDKQQDEEDSENSDDDFF